MTFSNLGPREKDAFFGLLDEYFQSRPEIFGAATGAPAQAQGHGLRAPANLGDGTPGSMMKQAMIANPEATAKVFSAGLRHAANAASPPPPGRSPAQPASPPAHGEEPDDGPPTSVASRIAALRGGGSGTAGGASSGLSTSQRFGNLDTSSAKGFMNSLGKSKPSPPAAAPVQPVLPKTGSSSFAPPPTRRVFPQAHQHEPEEVEELEPAPPAAPPPPPPPPGRKTSQREEPKGEWAEALYDYDSVEAGDLKIKEGQRVLVTERSSDDWWTGEVNGKSGLFPASYVQLV
ncbi:hypothetical protein BKA70DRAFT_755148 [Coprinopsis sp. MPI-PUGE-AT-0042]|nr:hypothetical protein BKA70DRAFT_755148 [Coprinopsis sp. MPI-PUGE-AT-0042]